MERTDIIQLIEDHAARTGLAPATITSKAVANSRLYRRMKDGGDCTTEIARKIVAFIAASNSPQGEAS